MSDSSFDEAHWVKVRSDSVELYEYLFQREKDGWKRIFSDLEAVRTNESKNEGENL
jgi:hypothetical protein